MNTGAEKRRGLFEGKRILVTGGTGSLGKVLTRRLLTGECGHAESITIFSRDEAKQYDMRLAFHDLAAATEEIIYRDVDDVLHFRIGDVRDYASISSALSKADVLFNAAALKQVPTCEFFPFEAVQTNVTGAENIVCSIEQLGLPIETVIGISTDKACKPVNVMGMSKAIQERVFISANQRCSDTRFICVRYGNVLASRGSVIPLFHAQIKAGGPVTITTNDMTRFLLSLSQAVDTIFDACLVGRPGETFIPRIPSSLITSVADSLINGRTVQRVEIGIRPGEKIHEILVAEDETYRTVTRDGYYVVKPILPELVQDADEAQALTGEYTSRTEVMSPEDTRRLLEANHLTIEDGPDFSKIFE